MMYESAMNIIARQVFRSAQIPGEMLDLLVVDTATLKANPNLGTALAGIWYETVALMQRQDGPCRFVRIVGACADLRRGISRLIEAQGEVPQEHRRDLRDFVPKGTHEQLAPVAPQWFTPPAGG